VIEPKAQN